MIEIRELLELAALACGITIVGWFGETGAPYIDHNYTRWNPYNDDGDCARMEAQHRIDVAWFSESVESRGYSEEFDLIANESESFSDHAGDRNAARRLASLRVAAEIGRRMKEASKP